MAIWSRDGVISERALAEGIAQLAHRGPDGRGAWIAPHRHVALAHTRLSIIDIDGGAQPIANEDERLQVVVNGEFYQHDEIRRELEGRGHQLRTRSDSEIVLHLYEDLGVHCLKRLRGEFAFVLWDERHHALFAARDRFGIKPLYYAWIGGTLYLASEAKALFAAGVEPRWDHESIHQFYEDVLFDHDRSLFSGVYQLPPGHFLMATQGGVRIAKYWDLDYPRHRAEEDGTEAERVQRAFDEAVRVRLRADVPVGCYLSGGIDSSAVLGMMARHATTPIDAYTICFDQPAFNEESVASEMARHAGARFHPLVVSEADLADQFGDAIWNAEIFVFNAHAVAKHLLSRLVRDRGQKVVLTGEGSDEIFGGYTHLRRDAALAAIEEGRPGAEQALARLIERYPAMRDLTPELSEAWTATARRVLGFVPSIFEGRRARANRREILSAEFFSELSTRDPMAMWLNTIDVQGQLAGRDRVHQSMYLACKSGLPNYILNTLGDRVEMAHSIEGRLPFLDHLLVEEVVNMPASVKIRGSDLMEKWVLREAVRPFVTPTVFERPKHPFLAPPLRPGGPFEQAVQDLGRSQSLTAIPFLDHRSVVALLDRLPSMAAAERGKWDGVLLNILSAVCLQERFRPAAG